MPQPGTPSPSKALTLCPLGLQPPPLTTQALHSNPHSLGHLAMTLAQFPHLDPRMMEKLPPHPQEVHNQGEKAKVLSVMVYRKKINTPFSYL